MITIRRIEMRMVIDAIVENCQWCLYKHLQ